MLLGAFSPLFASAQVAATPTDVQSIVQMITDLQVQLLLAKIAELKAEIAKLMESTNQVVQNTTPALGAQPVSPAVPVQVPLTATLGNPLCYSYRSVLVPVSVSRDDWSKITFSYMGYGTVRENDGSETVNTNSVTMKTGDLNHAPTGLYPLTVNGGSTTTPMFALLNVHGGYNLSGTAYDKSGNVVANIPTQTVNVTSSCRTSDSDNLLRIVTQ